MSSVTTWLTEAQVQETLEELSGRRGRVGHNENVYLLKGSDPPPVLTEAEDEEMQLQFGDAIRAAQEDLAEITQPDLQGITDLLRLVKGSDTEEDKEDTSGVGQPSNCFITISKGIQLNPNVEEFLPKGAISSRSSSDISVNKSKTVEKTEDKAPNAKMDDDTLLATTLKNKISDAAKSNSFEVKKEKNVAIATLLRLYASNNKPASPPNNADKLKLMTPDYFESRNSSENVQPELTAAAIASEVTSLDIKSLTSKSQTSSSNDVNSEPILSSHIRKKSPKPKMDPSVKTSIEKVNQWLGEPVERKSPVVYLGPIPFKKKQPTTACKSTEKQTAEVQNNLTNHNNEYKPSNFAADLEKKYLERNKSKKEQQKINMWTDLHIVLKEKDNLRKKKHGSENGTDIRSQ